MLLSELLLPMMFKEGGRGFVRAVALAGGSGEEDRDSTSSCVGEAPRGGDWRLACSRTDALMPENCAASAPCSSRS